MYKDFSLKKKIKLNSLRKKDSLIIEMIFFKDVLRRIYCKESLKSFSHFNFKINIIFVPSNSSSRKKLYVQ